MEIILEVEAIKYTHAGTCNVGNGKDGVYEEGPVVMPELEIT